MKPVKPTAVPGPPGFHWIFVLLLSVVTVGIFGDIWSIVQALWVRKLDRSSKALQWFIVSTVLSFLTFVLESVKASQTIEVPVFVAALALGVMASFKVRDSLGEYITRVEGTPTFLSGVMTIFLGPVYLQFHMNRVRSFQRHTALSAQ